MKVLSSFLVLCALGVALLIASSVWTNWVSSSVVWSEEQAIRKQEAGARFHQAAHAHGAHHDHGGHTHDDSVSAAELAEAEKAYNEQQALLEKAIARQAFWGNLMYYGGIGIVVVGAVGYFVAKNIIENQE